MKIEYEDHAVGLRLPKPALVETVALARDRNLTVQCTAAQITSIGPTLRVYDSLSARLAVDVKLPILIRIVHVDIYRRTYLVYK